jgi:hypothetical protein
MSRRQESFLRMTEVLEQMKKAGWVKHFSGENADTGWDITWTPVGAKVLETVWALMEEVGGNTGRGCDQSTWGALAYLALVRYRDPGVGPQFGN